MKLSLSSPSAGTEYSALSAANDLNPHSWVLSYKRSALLQTQGIMYLGRQQPGWKGTCLSYRTVYSWKWQFGRSKWQLWYVRGTVTRLLYPRRLHFLKSLLLNDGSLDKFTTSKIDTIHSSFKTQVTCNSWCWLASCLEDNFRCLFTTISGKGKNSCVTRSFFGNVDRGKRQKPTYESTRKTFCSPAS